MGLKASVLTLTHFLITFGLAIVLAVGFASNNWIEGSFIKGTHGVTYTSGLFLGCMNFLNKTGLCSNKIVYGAKATFNLNLGGNPEDFILKLVRLAYNMYLLQPIDQEEFEIHEEFFDEGSLTFTNVFPFYNSQDSDSIFCARYLISGGIILVVSSAMLNFFLSCAYSVKAIRVMVGLYVFGAIMITMGSNIIYISYAIDQCYKNPEINITMGFGMILTIIGIIGILAMSVLLSVTLLTVEKAKIKDIVKTATLVNRATMRTLNRPAPLNCGSYSHAGSNDYNNTSNPHTFSTLGGRMTAAPASSSNNMNYETYAS